MKLYFIRHAKRGHGENQDTLVEEGIEQSKKLVGYFKKIPVNKIICGSSNRARKTLEPSKEMFNIDVEYTEEVNEQSLGILEGESAEKYRKALAESGLNERDFAPKNGESEIDAYNRAKKFVERLKEEKAENILIISHSGFISNVSTILLKEPIENNKNYKSDFCALTYFELDKEFNVLDFQNNKKII